MTNNKASTLNDQQVREIMDFFLFISYESIQSELNTLFRSYVIDQERIEESEDPKQMAIETVSMHYMLEKLGNLLRIIEPEEQIMKTYRSAKIESIKESRYGKQ